MNAHDVVTSRMAEQARRFPDLLLNPLDLTGLEPRDAALAWAIEHAVLRRWLTLQRVIEHGLSRPWAEVEHKLQAVLLVGAAQLLLLERIPDHAAIHESVELAKRHVRAGAGGFVNAVLRKVAGLSGEITSRSGTFALARHELPLGDGRLRTLHAEVFDDSSIRRLAQQTSHPESLLMNWIGTHGEDQSRRMALHNLMQPPTIVHDAADHSPQPLSPTRAIQPHSEPGFFVFDGDRAELVRFLAGHSSAIVQDPASAQPVEATRGFEPAPLTIIDACAGMGTKTRQLAAIHPAARIIATDVAQQRSDILREQFAGNDRVQIIDHQQLRQFDGQADVILLDVPCSNSGVLARRVEAKYRITRQSLQSLIDIQRQIIADSLPLLRRDGRIVYSTCSVDPAENQAQARWLCQWHRFHLEREHVRLPAGQPGDPLRHYSDGGYFAILKPVPN